MINKKNINIIEILSFILILIWCFNPIILCALQHFGGYDILYTKILTYSTGICGYIYYILNTLLFSKSKKLKLKEILKNNIPQILLFLLLIWAIISTIFAKNKTLAIFGEEYRNEGLIIYFMYLGIILLSSIIKNKTFISYFSKSIIFSAIVIITISILTQTTNGEVISYGYSNIFNNANHFGYYLLISTMLASFNFINENNKIKRIIYLLVFIYLNYFLIVNDTFACFLAYIISIISLLIYSIKTKWNIKNNIIIIVIIIIMSLFIKNNLGVNIAKNNLSSFYSDIKTILKMEKKKINKEKISSDDITNYNNVGTYRMLLWKKAGVEIKLHPIVGIGIEGLKDYYYSIKIIEDRPHNIVIQIAAFIGIPGATIYLALIFYLAFMNLKRMLKEKNNERIAIFFTAMAYFISSLFGNSMYYTSPYFMILLGSLIGFLKVDYNKKQKTNMLHII